MKLINANHCITDAQVDLRRSVTPAVEKAILATGTGAKRNKLTEANIHLMSAQQALEEASKL